MDTKLECEVDVEGTMDMMFRGEEIKYRITKDTKKSRGNSRVLPDCRSEVPIGPLKFPGRVGVRSTRSYTI